MSIEEFSEIVDRALWEDLAGRGDLTSEAIVAANATSRADLVVRTPGVIAGLTVAEHVFHRVDPSIVFSRAVREGDPVAAGAVAATLSGPARSILTAERTALNLLGRMSGVATATARLVEEVAGTGAVITDTRKTMPGLRALDKYAVTVGGGVNHRKGLYDQVMIKDNHIAAAGDIRKAVAATRTAFGADMKVIVEVEDLDQLVAVLETSADRVLLDNMGPDKLREAVQIVGVSLETEASGGVTLETVRSIADTGVDFISVGWITHSAPQLDIALDFV